MNLNSSNLSHPRIQWEIEAAMWRAIETSKLTGYAVTDACSAAGSTVITVVHDRARVPAFSFFRGGLDVSEQVINVLRKQEAV